MPENSRKENTTEMMHDISENKNGIEEAKNKIKIDRSHGVGRRRAGNNKPSLIVVINTNIQGHVFLSIVFKNVMLYGRNV